MIHRFCGEEFEVNFHTSETHTRRHVTVPRLKCSSIFLYFFIRSTLSYFLHPLRAYVSQVVLNLNNFSTVSPQLLYLVMSSDIVHHKNRCTAPSTC